MGRFEATLLKDLRQNEREWPGAYQRIDGLRCFSKAFRLPARQKLFAYFRLRILVWRGLVDRALSHDLRPLPMYRLHSNK